MRNYIILAILSVCFFCFVLLFKPISGKKKPVGKNTGTTVQTTVGDGENIFLKKMDSPMAEKPKDKEKIFEVQDGPRDTAYAHSMEEKYFTPYNVHEFQNMSSNMAEKLDSIAKAIAKKNKAKKDYVIEK